MGTGKYSHRRSLIGTTRLNELFYCVLGQDLLELQAWVYLWFYERAADFYEWLIHKMCVLDTEEMF